MSKVLYAQLIFTIGSVAIYEAKSESFFFGRPTYFWKFLNSTDYYGPFDTLLETGMNFDQVMRGNTVPTEQPSSTTPVISVQEDQTNVIRVDFKSKKRIK